MFLNLRFVIRMPSPEGNCRSPLTPHALEAPNTYRDRLPILAIIGNWYFYKIPLFFARLLQNYLLNNFITS